LHSYVWHDSWDMTRSYVWHDSSICETWFSRHDLFICVTWLFRICDSRCFKILSCDFFPSCRSLSAKEPLIIRHFHTCDLTRSYLWLERPQLLGVKNAFSCMSLSAKEPLTIRLFCGKFVTREASTTGWQRCTGCFQLQVSLRRRATNYTALLRNICNSKGINGSVSWIMICVT